MIISSCIRFINYIKGKTFKDEYPFDLGFNFSFTSTIGLMSLLFSTSIPIVSFFAMFFFFARYFIEKYNVIFVYQQEFESRGTMR